jgi:hypothetical protein
LAERRARRATETGEEALTRRAEAAEATVRTLEVHVSTLQGRLGEVEEERRVHVERAKAERAAVLEREAELRRVKQREYAEQQLRVEAEERLQGVDRDSRAQIDRLSRRLTASEQEARQLAQRLESVQRALAEAEQAAAAERTAVRRGERELQARLTELECRALEIQTALGAERAARERAEAALEAIRRAHHKVEVIVGETRVIVGRLAAAFATASQPRTPRPPPPAAIRAVPEPRGEHEVPRATAPADAEERSGEMAEALAAAVERLRARAEEPPPETIAETVTVGGQRVTAGTETMAPAPERMAPGAQTPATLLQAARARAQAETARAARPPLPRAAPESPPVSWPPATQMAPVQPLRLPRHKHSMSWIGRWRIRRKQRRGR